MDLFLFFSASILSMSSSDSVNLEEHKSAASPAAASAASAASSTAAEVVAPYPAAAESGGGARRVKPDDYMSGGLLVCEPSGMEPSGCCGKALPRAPDAVGAFVDTPEEKFQSACPATLMVLMNPFSGNGRASRVFNVCKPVWTDAGIVVTVCNTTHARHALEIGQTTDFSAYKGVAVIGGDGTCESIV